MAHHDHSHDKNHQHHDHRSSGKKVHPAWWIVVAAILALAGMFLYNLTREEALQPGGKITEDVPVAE